MWIYLILPWPVILLVCKRYFKWLDIILRLLYRCVMIRKQGELAISNDLVYAAGGSGVDAKYSLVVTPTNHTCTHDGIRINQSNLRRYKSLCGYDPQDRSVPACYGETLCFKLLLDIISSSKFALAPLGLIHIRQTIVQHESLSKYLTSDLTLSGTVKQYRQAERGVEVDIELRILVTKDRCVWQGVVTLFSRGRNARRQQRPTRENTESDDSYPVSASFHVPANCGVKYAWLSGDINPHHMFTWSAKLVGYQRPIAHGMWTLAKAIAIIQEREGELAVGRVHLSCNFKRPLFMPAGVVLLYDEPGAIFSTGCTFRVEDRDTGTPHLIGDVRIA